MLGILSLFLHIYVVLLFISSSKSAKTCKTDKGRIITGWDWEVRNDKGESYFINICGPATKCGKTVSSVCKNQEAKEALNYGAVVTKDLQTTPYGNGFSIIFDGTVNSKTGCDNSKIQTKINFQCEKTLGSPKFIDDNGCMVIIEFFTKEACKKQDGIKEIPCVIFNPIDKKKRDLSPLIKLSGGHQVSSESYGVHVFINVCRDIKFNDQIPDNACSDGGKQSPACRKDIRKPIGKITDSTKLYYKGDKIKLVYKLAKTTRCPNGVVTDITFFCQEHFSNGGAGPHLVTNASEAACHYDIIWGTGHACANNDVITDKCKFSNGEVSFDLTKLEKSNKQLSYGVRHGDYEYRIKVCSNGQPCGKDVLGTHTAVCQVKTTSKTPQAVSCGSADDRSVRYADGDLTMVYKSGTACKSNNINRRTIITFRCDPAVDVGEPSFLQEEHCYYYFEWRTRHVCQSRKAGACSVSKNETYDLSILTKVNTSWLVVNSRKEASGFTYYINVCGSLATDQRIKTPECRESAACEVDQYGKERGVGVSKTAPAFKSGSLRLVYNGGKCAGFAKSITSIIKFVCKSKDLESPPELESKSWDGCDYVFSWATAAACPLQVVTGKGCFLEDFVTGNVYDLSPLATGTDGKNYFNVTTGPDEYYIKVCGDKKGLDKSVCGGKDAGICQKTQNTYHIAGRANDNLYYRDGVLKLTFKKGDPCKRQKQPERRSYITFYCDESAGAGKPVFVGETEYCLYNFAWYTKYACPMKTMECAVKDSKGNEYDLSRLVKTTSNWHVTKNGITYYINICRVLHQTQNCPTKSSVCMKFNNGTGVGIGEIVGPLTVDDKNHPVLQYQSNRYRTIITFLCDHQGQVGEPVLDSSGNGVYSFTWTTKEACKVQPKDESGCNDKDTRISVLRKPEGYTINLSTKEKIIFGICHNITCGEDKTSTACFINAKGEAISIGRSAQSFLEHSLDVTSLTYPGGAWNSTDSWGGYFKTKINFVCDPKATDGKPEFIKHVQNVYVIEFKTSVVCGSMDVGCSVTSKNNQHYDLNSLTLKKGSWMAEDTRSNLDYYINVCDEYIPGDAKYQCKGAGGIGACQVDKKGKNTHNMGYVVSGPVLSPSGHVTLRYSGGEICHGKYDRSTRINFFCSHVHGSPVFMVETKDCEYVFNWRTPSGCAVVNSTVGENCAVYDKQYGFYFDLSKLKEDDHTQSIEKNTNYNVGFCSKTPKSCKKGYQSCLVKGGTVISNFKLESMVYNDQKIIITHKNSTQFTIMNEITCDPAGDTLSPNGKTEIDSGFKMLWKSSFVCPPVRGEECSLTHDFELYDLSVLAKENWNWIARNELKDFGGVSDYQFYFSVCKPLKNFTGLANKGSRAAMVKDGKSTSLGTMIKPLTFSKGYLTMIYGHGDKSSLCVNLTTTIQFVCDNVVPGGVGVGPVVDGFDKPNCEFHVTWLTRAACPVRSLLGNPSAPCTAVHPATKKTIDLGPLKNKNGYSITDQENDEYLINVCGDVGGGCPKNSGMCKKKVKVNVGSVNSTLVYRQGFLYLHYKNGDTCNGYPGRKMETFITFMCDPTKGKGTPKLERTNDCTHFVTWKTNLACEAEVDCVAHNGKVFYDLTPLIRNDANYELQNSENGKKYLVNVCRSLVNNSRCPADAAICSNEKSFGRVMAPPSVVQGPTEVKAQLVYTNGNKCKTIIRFVCDAGDNRRMPVIAHADDCSVNITWWTSLVCPKTIYNTDCEFSDSGRNFCFDLKKLNEKNPPPVSIPNGNIHFHVCGKVSDHCKGAKDVSACLKVSGKPSPIGLKLTNITYNGEAVRISYNEQAIMILYCGRDTSIPQYIGQYQVNKDVTKYFFIMVTPEVCPPRKLSCEVTHDGKTYNLAGLSKNDYEVRSEDKDKYLISICAHVKTKICSSRATAVKISTKQVIAVDTGYSLTYQEEDSYPLHLRYTSSEPICGKRKAKVLHKFKCSHSTSSPQFQSFDSSSCEYTFLWRTSEACAEKRTPLKQLGGDWRFDDESQYGCELDLSSLKKEVLKRCKKEDKKGQLGSSVEVFTLDDQQYGLTVNCTVPNPKRILRIDVNMQCGNDSNVTEISKTNLYMSLFWETTTVCVDIGTSCSNTFSRSASKSAIAVIGTLAGIGLLAAIIFFACKREKRETTALWLRWHIRKYLCCKPSYQASYRYKKVNTDEEDGETEFIIEAGAGSLFSDDSDDDNHNSDDKDDDDDDLLPLDDDLLNLDE